MEICEALISAIHRPSPIVLPTPPKNLHRGQRLSIPNPLEIRMRHAIAATLMLAASSAAQAYDRNDWPTHIVLDDGTDIGLSAAFQYDWLEFSKDRLDNGSHRFNYISDFKRREAGFFVRKKGVYDAGAIFDFETRQWQDVYARVQTKAWSETDWGALRFGQTKTLVGFEGVTSSRATSFLETALPVQAVYAGRRIGVDWAYERPNYLLNAAYYGGDLQGDNDGNTLAGRVAWTPRKKEGSVVHWGLAVSREDRDATKDGRGVVSPASARFRARPEVGLTDVRLVDSGNLINTRHIDRAGIEAVWIEGPWSIQGEYLTAKAQRQSGLADYRADGYYVFGSWIVTGESRSYSGGNTGNLKPRNAYGALELLLRYSTLDLDDGIVRGGRQSDWTFGANWIIDSHFKVQANYIRAESDRANVRLDPHIFAVRAQITF
jgi:phosphate-selective porin OprO/OprP